MAQHRCASSHAKKKGGHAGEVASSAAMHSAGYNIWMAKDWRSRSRSFDTPMKRIRRKRSVRVRARHGHVRGRIFEWLCDTPCDDERRYRASREIDSFSFLSSLCRTIYPTLLGLIYLYPSSSIPSPPCLILFRTLTYNAASVVQNNHVTGESRRRRSMGSANTRERELHSLVFVVICGLQL
jgi:hypothetical protein